MKRQRRRAGNRKGRGSDGMMREEDGGCFRERERNSYYVSFIK